MDRKFAPWIKGCVDVKSHWRHGNEISTLYIISLSLITSIIAGLRLQTSGKMRLNASDMQHLPSGNSLNLPSNLLIICTRSYHSVTQLPPARVGNDYDTIQFNFAVRIYLQKIVLYCCWILNHREKNLERAISRHCVTNDN